MGCAQAGGGGDSRGSTNFRIPLNCDPFMKARQLTLLVLLNAALVAAGFYFFRGGPSFRSPEELSLAEERVSLQSPWAKTSAVKQNPVVHTKTVYVTNQFHWREVESDDYRQYITNLRAIGCPESTIKDMILTDILKLYSARRGQFYHNGREFKFWETDEKRKLNARQLEEREKQLASIDREIPAVLRDLLGINYEREMNKYFVDANEEGRRLSFLPEEKRIRLLALRDEIEGMKERILDAANGRLSADDQSALRKIETLRQTELGKLLSESELAEFELRMSPTADKLRADLIGFNPSETEFRQVFELKRAIEDKYAFAGPVDVTAAENELRDELKRRLGSVRYAEYERSLNPDFQSACVFAEVYELPSATAQTLFDIKQVAEAETQNLLSNSSIPELVRAEALRAIQLETERSLRETLGPKVFSNYAQSSGKWIQHLGPN